MPLDLRSVVYCTAIRHGSDKEWQFLWERYGKSNVGTERSLILSALGCSREIWLLQRYLDWTLDESTGVRKQDRGTVFGGVARNDIGLLLAKSFFFDKVDDIYNKLVLLLLTRNHFLTNKIFLFIRLQLAPRHRKIGTLH